MKTGIRFGLVWGIGMFVMMCLFFPWYENKEITMKSILSGLLIFGLGALILEYAIGRKNPDIKK